MHTPVLLQAVIENLNVQPGHRYIDATLGEAGHLQALLEKGAKVLAIDLDENQVKRAQEKIKSENVIWEVSNYSAIEEVAQKHSFVPVDGIIFDLGLSMYQITNGERGFSYSKPEDPLDMRLDGSQELTAEYIINTYSEDELYELFARYAEELKSADIAKKIVQQRVHNRIHTVGELVTLINNVIGVKRDNYSGKSVSRIFQALRIAVNDEFHNIEQGLQGAVNILSPEGRIAVITFHSLEDRIVKQFVRKHNLKEINKHVITGDRSFERSAKLRIFTK